MGRSEGSTSSIDRIARMLGSRTNRRKALVQIGGAGAIAAVGGSRMRALAQSDDGVTCTLRFQGSVTSSTLCGTWFDVSINFSIGDGGAIDDGQFVYGLGIGFKW